MTMLERIARAIYSKHGFCYDDDERMFEPYPFDELDEIERANFVSQARAALIALRDPTEGMIDAGVTADTGKTLGDRVTLCWQALIPNRSPSDFSRGQ